MTEATFTKLCTSAAFDVVSSVCGPQTGSTAGFSDWLHRVNQVLWCTVNQDQDLGLTSVPYRRWLPTDTVNPLSIRVTFTAIVPGAYRGGAKCAKTVLKWRKFVLTGWITGKRLKLDGYMLRLTTSRALGLTLLRGPLLPGFGPTHNQTTPNGGGQNFTGVIVKNLVQK